MPDFNKVETEKLTLTPDDQFPTCLRDLTRQATNFQIHLIGH